MTAAERIERYASKNDAGEYWRGAKAIERGGEEAIAGGVKEPVPDF